MAPGAVEKKIREQQSSMAQTIAVMLCEEGCVRSFATTDLEYLFTES